MSTAILQANLGNFDVTRDPVPQDSPSVFHRWTDENFPPITGLLGRFQYRIPKLFGWEMFPGHDYYIWLDGGITFKRPDSVGWYLEQMGDNDALFFKHPWRSTIWKECKHIEDRLQRNDPYITPRYKNGLHKEQLAMIQADKDYVDDKLYASTVFAYKNTPKVQQMLKDWWFLQSRYYTCDQLALPYVIWKNKLNIKVIEENLFKLGHVCLISKHK